ncbi:hypothetical protein T265_14415, partial [Opisthorchis viverrini]
MRKHTTRLSPSVVSPLRTYPFKGMIIPPYHPHSSGLTIRLVHFSEQKVMKPRGSGKIQHFLALIPDDTKSTNEVIYDQCTHLHTDWFFMGNAPETQTNHSHATEARPMTTGFHLTSIREPGSRSKVRFNNCDAPCNFCSRLIGVEYLGSITFLKHYQEHAGNQKMTDASP